MKAEEVNITFERHLEMFMLNPVSEVAFKKVIIDIFTQRSSSTSILKKQYIEQITSLNNKITRARELVLNGDIDGSDFRIVKAEAEREIVIIEANINDLQHAHTSVGKMRTTLDEAAENLCRLKEIYRKSDCYKKRKLVGSIYPEKSLLKI